jgi:hypothetical protein
MAMIGTVRRLHYRQQKSVREIARITSLSRHTVRKGLKAPVAGGRSTGAIRGPATDGVSRGIAAGARGRCASAVA